MVKQLVGFALALLLALFLLHRIESGAAADERLKLQQQHNVELLALTKEQRKQDSIKAAEVDSLKAALARKVRQLARVNARADSLLAVLEQQVDSLPPLIPACDPWAAALTTCQKALAAKDSVAKGLTIAFDSATAYSDTLGILLGRANARGDSLARNLHLTNEAIDKSRCTIIFGVRCPSRTQSFIGGGILGAVLYGVLK